MHGAGNDYVYIDCFKNVVEQPEKLAVEISDRHFGVGSDGLVLILPSEIADCKMRIFNADGSEAKMCGNAIRCVGKYLYENYYSRHRHSELVSESLKNQAIAGLSLRATTRNRNDKIEQNILKVETLSGIKTLEIFTNRHSELVSESPKNQAIAGQARNDEIEVKVDMGKADFTAKNIPIICNSDTCINQPLEIDGKEFLITAVSIGNPHCVVFCKSVDEIPLEMLGTKFEHNAIFPERVNTEFVQIIDNQTIKMRVWESGSGETMACGTGACASVAAAIKNNLLNFDTEICVQLKGGELFINCKPDYQIFMRGNAVEVFRGEF